MTIENSKLPKKLPQTSMTANAQTPAKTGGFSINFSQVIADPSAFTSEQLEAYLQQTKTTAKAMKSQKTPQKSVGAQGESQTSKNIFDSTLQQQTASAANYGSEGALLAQLQANEHDGNGIMGRIKNFLGFGARTAETTKTDKASTESNKDVDFENGTFSDILAYFENNEVNLTDEQKAALLDRLAASGAKTSFMDEAEAKAAEKLKTLLTGEEKADASKEASAATNPTNADEATETDEAAETDEAPAEQAAQNNAASDNSDIPNLGTNSGTNQNSGQGAGQGAQSGSPQSSPQGACQSGENDAKKAQQDIDDLRKKAEAAPEGKAKAGALQDAGEAQESLDAANEAIENQNANEAEAERLRGEYERAQEAYTQAEKELGQKDKEVQEAEKDVTAKETQLSETKAFFSKQEKEVTRLTTEVQTAGVKLTSATARVEILQERFKTEQSSGTKNPQIMVSNTVTLLNEARDEQTAARTKFNEAKTKLASATNEKNQTQQKITNQEKELNAAKNSLGDKKAVQEYLKDCLVDKENAMDTIYSQLGDLTRQMSSVQDKVDGNILDAKERKQAGDNKLNLYK